MPHKAKTKVVTANNNANNINTFAKIDLFNKFFIILNLMLFVCVDSKVVNLFDYTN